MSCKDCFREYQDRPNDLCKNPLHWWDHCQKLEIELARLTKKVAKLKGKKK